MNDQIDTTDKKSARSGENMTLEEQMARMMEKIEANERLMIEISTKNQTMSLENQYLYS